MLICLFSKACLGTFTFPVSKTWRTTIKFITSLPSFPYHTDAEYHDYLYTVMKVHPKSIFFKHFFFFEVPCNRRLFDAC